MLHFGIPAYRLPRADLMTEIHRIEAMGVKITLNHKVDDLLAEQAEGRFDAVFVAIGAQIGKRSTYRRGMRHASSTPSPFCTKSGPGMRRGSGGG